MVSIKPGTQHPLALRAGEASSPRMLRPHIHPPIGHRQLDPAHLPRGDQTQQMPVQLGVTHPGIMPRDRLITTRKPTEKPEAPNTCPLASRASHSCRSLSLSSGTPRHDPRGKSPTNQIVSSADLVSCVGSCWTGL